MWRLCLKASPECWSSLGYPEPPLLPLQLFLEDLIYSRGFSGHVHAHDGTPASGHDSNKDWISRSTFNNGKLGKIYETMILRL